MHINQGCKCEGRIGLFISLIEDSDRLKCRMRIRPHVHEDNLMSNTRILPNLLQKLRFQKQSRPKNAAADVGTAGRDSVSVLIGSLLNELH